MRVRRLRKFVRPRTGELLSFENKHYYITDEGQVYDGDRHRYVTQYEIQGYLHASLKDDNGKWHRTMGTHALVASVFIRLLQLGEEVHHIDHNPRNNNLSNLEILNSSEHQRQHTIEKWKNGLIKTKNVGTSRPAKAVAQLTLDGRLVRVWPSTMECGRNGFNHQAISACCRNCFHRHGNNVYNGFRWQWYVKINR